MTHDAIGQSSMTSAPEQWTQHIERDDALSLARDLASARAVVFEAPGRLSVQSLELAQPQEADLVVAIQATGISSGTERLLWNGEMPDFPGMGYPLVPGYEAIGQVVAAGRKCQREVGEHVFVGGAQCFPNIKSLFGSAASKLVVPDVKAQPIDNSLGSEALLLALAATAHHILHTDNTSPTIPDLVIGHGVVGRLLARLCVALGHAAPTVWEINPARQHGGDGYHVVDPRHDDNKYHCIADVSGDNAILDKAIQHLQKRDQGQSPPQVLLGGFYKAPLTFQFAPAFMREVRIQVAAEWQPADMQAVSNLVATGHLSLGGLITHTVPASQAARAYNIAFRDEQCLKMVLDWSAKND
jgi:3-hydroxyethyl bacteriochlorophyllide a dehydrogenase